MSTQGWGRISLRAGSAMDRDWSWLTMTNNCFFLVFVYGPCFL